MSVRNQENQSLSKTGTIEPRWWFLFGMVALGVCSRLLPHPVNFSPVAGVALFAGAAFGGWRSAVVVPLATMLVSDLFLGLHWTMPLVYASIGLNIVIGRLFVNMQQPWTIPACSLLGSVQFFVITNLACMQEASLAGLTRCYIDAIPFFQNSLAADFLFSAIFFSLLAIAQNMVPALRANHAVPMHS